MCIIINMNYFINKVNDLFIEYYIFLLDGLIGIALVGGALVLVISGIVGLVMVFRRRK